MPALAVFCLESVADRDALARYRASGRDTLVKYGARFLAGPNIVKTLEGEPLEGFVVVEFESVERAEAWYRSPEYQAIVGIRLDATSGRAFIVETRT
jgi:uncharacterized protein (DUF1330 family)